MSNIGKNIKKIRSVRKISQAEFAKLFDLARPSVGAYEEGRSEPKIETLIQIASHFNISIDVLLTKSLSVADLLSFGDLNKKLSETHQRLSPTTEKTVEEGIPFLKTESYLDYTINYKSSGFVNGLPCIQIPVPYDGLIRAFEMQGSEMEYHQQGLHHGDILICQGIAMQDVKEDTVLVLVMKDKLMIRRLSVKIKHLLTLVPDDPNYDAIEVREDEILELWVVKSVFTEYLNGPKLLDEKILGMEKRLSILERVVRKLM